jgi:hypothetical protein
MRKLIASIAMMALAGTLAIASPRQDRDDHRQDRDDRRDRDDRKGGDDHHDNGKHDPYGLYENVKRSFVSVSIDYRTRRVVLYDRSNWVVAPYDIDRCRDWRWDRDDVFVYDDDHHPG